MSYYTSPRPSVGRGVPSSPLSETAENRKAGAAFGDTSLQDRAGENGTAHERADEADTPLAQGCSGGVLDSAIAALRQAVADLAPNYIVSMVSGGKDSAASHALAIEAGLKIDLVIHGNTRCGIPETTQFVMDTYGNGGPELVIADAGTAYEDYVLRKGFFGKGIDAHGFAYRVLKATPFRKAVSKHLRQRRRSVKVLLINGARKDESANRTANLKVSRSDPAAPGNIWFNSIHDFSQENRDAFLASRGVPINPVAKALCRSGECMCGTMQSDADRAEAAVLFPTWGRWLKTLEEEVRAVHGFGWGEAFPRRDTRQADFFQPMCVGCTRNAEPPPRQAAP